MSSSIQLRPETLGLFEQRFAGDASLIHLARRRFLEAHMGIEVHVSTTEQLDWFASARPWGDAPMVVHLPRDFDLLQESTSSRILDLAARGSYSAIGLVLHDQEAMVARKADYLEAVRSLDRELERRRGATVFIEYAIGLDPVEFSGFFSAIPDLRLIAPCIDIGHVGIRAARAAFDKTHVGEDVCALKVQPAGLEQLMPDVDAAVASGVAVVLNLIQRVAALKKPVHFHLHDGHPLSTFSQFGVSDHLSFFEEIPLSFEYRGRRSVPTMFGPAGLGKVVRQALAAMDPAKVSFTLEIHPTGESLSLGDASSMFEHWTIKTNAERTNHWLWLLTKNHSLLLQAIDTALQPPG